MSALEEARAVESASLRGDLYWWELELVWAWVRIVWVRIVGSDGTEVA